MKKIFTTLSLVAILLTSCQSGKKDVFQKESDALNKQCPMMVDLQTRMDSTRYNKEQRTFSYYYSLKDIYKDSLYLARAPQELETNLIESLRQSAELRPYQEAGMTLQYIYLAAETGEILFRFSIPSTLY